MLRNQVGLVAIVAALCAAPLEAQQPALRDTTRHGTMGHQMPAQGTGQQQMMQGRAVPGGMSHDSAMGCAMMMRGGMMHDSAMGGAMMASPAHLLAMKADLRLTADQERRVTALRDAARTVHDAAMRDAEGSQRELAQVMQAAAPDAALLRRHFETAHAAMGRAHLSMLLAAAQARAVLTDAQRRQVDSMHAAMGQPQPQQPAHRH